MRRVSEIEKKITLEKPVSLALGFFDGVHKGHRKVIQQTMEPGYLSGVFTFDKKRGKESYLYTQEQKVELLEGMGVEVLISLKFEDIVELQPEEFIALLYHQFGVRKIVCGEDFAFGKNRAANVDMLKEVTKKFKIPVEVVPPVIVKDRVISSTWIKELLREGAIEEASELLEIPYFIFAPVVKGNQIGRTIERPTLNQNFAQGQEIPKLGAYVTKAHLEGQEKFSATNIGIKPTIGGEKAPILETFVLDFNQMIYGEKVKISFYRFVRPERKFDSLEELKEDILSIALKGKNLDG